MWLHDYFADTTAAKLTFQAVSPNELQPKLRPCHCASFRYSSEWRSTRGAAGQANLPRNKPFWRLALPRSPALLFLSDPPSPRPSLLFLPTIRAPDAGANLSRRPPPLSPFLPFTCTVTCRSITYCVFLLQEMCRLSVHKYAIFLIYTHIYV